MIELGLIVIGAYLGVLIFGGTVLAAALLAMLFAAIVYVVRNLPGSRRRFRSWIGRQDGDDDSKSGNR